MTTTYEAITGEADGGGGGGGGGVGLSGEDMHVVKHNGHLVRVHVHTHSHTHLHH